MEGTPMSQAFPAYCGQQVDYTPAVNLYQKVIENAQGLEGYLITNQYRTAIKKEKICQIKVAQMMNKWREGNGLDDEVRRIYGESTMTTREYTEKCLNITSRWDDLDRLLDLLYTTPAGIGLIGKDSGNDPVHISASIINRKLYNGEALNKEEQAVVDHFFRCAKPLGRDTDLYRMVDRRYLDTLADGGDLKSLEGKKILNRAPLSTAPGMHEFFDRKDVCMRIKTPGNMPVCMTQEVGEGEIVIPANSITGITRVEYHTRDNPIDVPIWRSYRYHRLFGTDRICGMDVPTHGSGVRTHDFIYVEMELVGYGDYRRY